jgi:hypothetical protein
MMQERDLGFRISHRLLAWLPSRGSVLFTLLVIALFFWGQSSGAFFAQESTAELPPSTGIVSYQGRLADSQGTPLTGTYDMVFRLYDLPGPDATLLWEESWSEPNSVQVYDGLFNVMLGSLNPVPQDTIVQNGALWLGISVGSDEEMTPRVQLGSVPFAMQANTVLDGSITTSKLADGAVTSGKIGDGNVATVDLANGAVTGAKIAADAVGSSHIAAGAVGASEIAADAVRSSEIAANAVTASEIAADAVGSSEIASGAVGGSEIANGAVTQTDAPTLIRSVNGTNREIQYGVACMGTTLDSSGFYYTNVSLSESFANTSYNVFITQHWTAGAGGTHVAMLKESSKTTTGFRVLSDAIGTWCFMWMAIGQ